SPAASWAISPARRICRRRVSDARSSTAACSRRSRGRRSAWSACAISRARTSTVATPSSSASPPSMCPERRSEDMPQLSVVVPVYNEAPNAEALVGELRSTLDRLTLTSEVVLVDDGSTDETFTLLAAACADDPRFRIVRLRRNFGQTAALAAGLDHA